MQIPPPELSKNDLTGWSLGFIDQTIHHGYIDEVKRNKRNWEKVVLENYDFIANQHIRLGSNISKKVLMSMVDTYLISKPLPRKLKVVQDSYPVQSLSIEYSKEDYGLIVKQRPVDFNLPIIRPAKVHWHIFWDELDQIDFWNLNEDFLDGAITDGFWGEIHITFGRKKKKINFNTGLPDTFNKLSNALRKLVSIPKKEEWHLF